MFELVYDNLKINVNENYSKDYKGDNICILKGPNDSGKTTTLSLIKFAFSNFKLDKIDNETMKNKIKLILDNPDFKMELSISSYNNNFKIKITYDNKSKIAEYFINDKSVGYTRFTEETELLYEVPGEAVKKLDGILYDINNKLSGYETILIEYENHLREIYNKLTEYEEYENTKKDIIANIGGLNKKLQSITPIYEEDCRNYQDLHNKYIYNEYQQLDLKISDIEVEINNLHKKIKKDKYKNVKINKQLNELIKNSKDVYVLIKYDQLLFDGFIEKNEEYQWIFGEGLKHLNDGDDLSEELISRFYKYFNNIKEQIEENLKNSSNSESILQYNLIEQLIQLINQYIDKNPIIPIFDDTASTLLERLYNERKKLKDINDKYIKLNDLKAACEHIISEFGKLSSSLRNYNIEKDKNNPKMLGEDEINGEDYQSQIDELEKQKNLLQKEKLKIEDEYNQLTRSYSIYDLDILRKNLENAEDKCKEDKKLIDSLNTDIKDQQNTLNSLKNIEKPVYTMTKTEIECENKRIDGLKKKLKKYKEYIELLLKNQYSNISQENTDKVFYDALGSYIANIIKFVYHLHNKYDLAGIDFINREYIIDPQKDTKISFDSIGTGTSTLNGLMTRIKQGTNGKKLVILVDEIGDMDNSNLQNLINIAESQIKSDRLLLMLMTRPDNNKSEACCESIKFS